MRAFGSLRPRRLLLATLLFPAALAHPARAAGGPAADIPVSIRVDASRTTGEMRPIWRFFGADEPNYACMKDGAKLAGELGALSPGAVYFRTHNLLTSGDGTPALKWGSTGAYREDDRGNPIYDWTIVDRIFDTYLRSGLKPYVEIGFMPEALSTRPEPYQHHWSPAAKYNAIFTGWAYPPKDYAKWAELVHRWALHCIDRYGRAEVETWYWEVWNEPNGGYWQGRPEDFRKLHDTAVDAVRRALPAARVGGADTAGPGGAFTRDFIEHCLHGTNYATGATGTPLDFISFHAKGSPVFVDGHVRMGIASQLRAIDAGFAIVASYPETKGKPIVIGESDPDGCAACQGPQLGYRNGTLYSSYTAASLAREYELMDRHGVNLVGALTWAFEFEDQPWFAGFRALATNGVDLPVLNVFRMFARMGGRRVAVASDGSVTLDAMMKVGVRGPPDVSALASLGTNALQVMAWNYHDDDVPGPEAAVTLGIRGLPPGRGEVRVTRYSIDADHSNAFTAWRRLGSPPAPTPEQFRRIEAAGRLSRVDFPSAARVDGGAATLHFTLSRQAVSLFVLEWDAQLGPNPQPVTNSGPPGPVVLTGL